MAIGLKGTLRIMFNYIKTKIKKTVKEDDTDVPPVPSTASRQLRRKGEVLDLIVIGVVLVIIVWMILFLYGKITQMSCSYFGVCT